MAAVELSVRRCDEFIASVCAACNLYRDLRYAVFRSHLQAIAEPRRRIVVGGPTGVRTDHDQFDGPVPIGNAGSFWTEICRWRIM